MDALKVENGGSIKQCVFNSGSVKRQFTSPGESQISEFIKGDGLRWSHSKIGNIWSQAVERELVSALRVEKVWWPSSWVS